MGLKKTRTKNRNTARFYHREIMRICMIASVILHGAALLAINKALPINWSFKPLRTYRVDLLRPSVEKIEEKQEAPGLASLKNPERQPQRPSEDTISLDTTDTRYVSYAKVIKQALMREWQYPLVARENLIEGELMALFTLARDGALLDVGIINSSGYEVLDGEAVRAIRAAAPYPPFPGSVEVERLHIKAKFDYKLGGPG